MSDAEKNNETKSKDKQQPASTKPEIGCANQSDEPMDRYVIAAKRGPDKEEGLKRMKLLAGLSGVRIQASQSGNRIQVAATPPAVVLIKQLLGGTCHIEKFTTREPTRN